MRLCYGYSYNSSIIIRNYYNTTEKYEDKQMNTVQVKNTVIGEGRPKICVPIVGKTKTDILEEAKKDHYSSC